ncbi:MAG: hypothetical protein GYB66_15995, partial [Chloroflexi bacterium]|nr:hypothetical protein [Chloroflexota bacterium]
MSQWSPPKISVHRLRSPWQRPESGGAGSAISGKDFTLILEALHHTVATDLRRTDPTIAPSTIQQAQLIAETEWLRLINASLPEGAPQFTLATFSEQSFGYTHEFYWLAHYYASSLSSSSVDFGSQFTAALIRRIGSQLRLSIRPLADFYQALPRLLQPATISPLTITDQGFRVISLLWQPPLSSKAISIEYQDLYLQHTRQFVSTVIREAPRLLRREDPIITEKEPDNSGTRIEWTVAWKKDWSRRARLVLGFGAILTIVCIAIVIAGILPMIFKWIALLPVVGGLAGYTAMRLGQYAGEKEYAHQQIIQETQDQVET